MPLSIVEIIDLNTSICELEVQISRSKIEEHLNKIEHREHELGFVKELLAATQNDNAKMQSELMILRAEVAAASNHLNIISRESYDDSLVQAQRSVEGRLVFTIPPPSLHI